MDSEVLTATSKGDSLSLASLRLLVPPLQLMTASMWQVLRQHDVMNYWKVAEFVSLVMDIVPELLIYKHRTQLNLGLRARYIIELCRSEQLVKPELILPYLDKFKSPHATPLDVEASEAEDVAVNVLELIQTLLKDPEERQNFFMEVFPAEFGSQYDRDLQTLFWEFHCRLTQLLPVPDLEETVSWLRAECSVLEDCVHSVSEPADLKNLLQHHKKLGHLEQHVPPSSMGDSILSSLSAVLPSRGSKPTEQPSQSDPAQGISEDAHTVTFVDDVAVEIITVTDYAEVELGPSSDIEVVMGENCFEGRVANTVAEDLLVALPEEKAKEEGSGETEEEDTQEKTNVHSEVNEVDWTSSQHGIPAGPHDCPDCEKKFKFASSLIAHRVIHTGERPHRCGDCGRCFSFRQSLDRHRHTHKTGRKYDCIICGETFHSLSARTEHKQTHMKDCVYTCHQCNKKFNWELSLARHLKTHTDEHSANVPTDDPREDGQAFEIAEANFSEANVELSESDCQVQANDNCGPEGERDKSGEHPTSQPKGLISESDNDVTTPGKVRTSGRKRRPTMKIQLINLQKQMMAKNRKEITRANPPPLKPLPFSCAEHSYGSPMVSSKDADDSSAADGGVDAFSCPTCSFHHSEEAQVQQHIDEVHSVKTTEDRSSLQALTDEEGYFSCADCEKSFRFHSLLRAHQRIHTGEQPFACSQCGRCFSFKQSLERHKQTHASGRQYECVICGEVFKSLAAQKEHKSTHMENGEYLCSECGRAFAWKSALVRHLKTHSVDADKSEESYKCPRCDLGFSCVSYLNRHLQTHQEERVHACNCGKSFAYRAALTAHQRIHQKERPHICTQCGKGFLYKGGLLSHMKIHSEEMPFMCAFCGKSFKRERNMKKHERCHTRENVFSCSQCDKSFVYKATLIRHELTHSGERPYLCSDCGKGFFSHAELLKHERFHTGHKPFQCPHCGKKFTQSCYLTIHLRYHTGVRPYSCNECDKSFLSANRLKRHQRTHSGEKPYVCGECGKGFRQSYNLKMHQRTHVMKLT